jgi:hypothetical protein
MHRVTPRPSGKMGCALQAGDEFRNGLPDGFLLPAINLPGAQGNRPFSLRSFMTDPRKPAALHDGRQEAGCDRQG